MLNIPTDLLRTLVAVVDLRSFTKAAQSLGVTQPAVSAQIKRLQFLLGYEILDKSAPGVSLTPRGEMVVAHARRMLSINDQIAQLNGGRPTAQTLRVGIPGDFAGVKIPATLAAVPQALAGHPFHRRRRPASKTCCAGCGRAISTSALRSPTRKPTIEAHHSLDRQAVWVRSDATQLDPERAGSAGVVRRGLLVPLHGGGRAPSRRA